MKRIPVEINAVKYELNLIEKKLYLMLYKKYIHDCLKSVEVLKDLLKRKNDIKHP